MPDFRRSAPGFSTCCAFRNALGVAARFGSGLNENLGSSFARCRLPLVVRYASSGSADASQIFGSTGFNVKGYRMTQDEKYKRWKTMNVTRRVPLVVRLVEPMIDKKKKPGCMDEEPRLPTVVALLQKSHCHALTTRGGGEASRGCDRRLR